MSSYLSGASTLESNLECFSDYVVESRPMQVLRACHRRKCGCSNSSRPLSPPSLPGAREAAFRNIKSISECLADELINAAKVTPTVGDNSLPFSVGFIRQEAVVMSAFACWLKGCCTVLHHFNALTCM